MRCLKLLLVREVRREKFIGYSHILIIKKVGQ